MRYQYRSAEARISQLASYFPVVAIVGPRQVGKTSLAQRIQATLQTTSLYLDLENPEDLIRINDPSLFLDQHSDKTVILDEVQLKPDLFPVLRGVIDRNRRPGRFILLGSASPDLIRDSSESLAGRIAYHELTPFTLDELPTEIHLNEHWWRGGFPDSLFAPDDELSRIWRQQFIRSYLERDLPLLGLSADPVLIGKLWRMLAHLTGDLMNYDSLSRALGISGPTVKSYLNFLEAAYLIRQLPPYFSNSRKRLVKSPKIYVRDTGVLHQLLGIPDFFQLTGHPAIGRSWETYVIEQISAICPDWAELSFYRTHQGTEADLVVLKGGKPYAVIEIKYSSAPKPTKGFFISLEDLGPEKQFIIAPVSSSFSYSENVKVLALADIGEIFS